MKKNYLIIFFVSIFLFSNSYAFDLNKIYKVKNIPAAFAYLEINKTNLVDEKFASNTISNVISLSKIVEKENKEFKKNNKNRKKIKSKGAEDIYSNYSDSVVYIVNTDDKGNNFTGSGFFINHNGIKIITNWHVIEDAEEINIWLKTQDMVGNQYDIRKEDSYTAKLIKFNKRKDLALLEVSNMKVNVKPLKYGKLSKVRTGENVFAIGHPKGLLWSFTNGMVSHKRKDYSWNYGSSYHKANVIQTTVPINPGNSGGPLFNKNEELVGVNTFTTEEGENLNFAVGIDDVIDFLNEAPKKIDENNKENNWIKKKKKGPTWIKKKKKKSTDSVYVIEKDYDGNGVIDTWCFDENENGIFEKIYHDRNEDGYMDVAIYDKNEDKVIEIALYDNDGNGTPEKAYIDKNEDGEMDIIAYDYDEDGKWDKYENV
mgnify:CR=1 FL=1